MKWEELNEKREKLFSQRRIINKRAGPPFTPFTSDATWEEGLEYFKESQDPNDSTGEDVFVNVFGKQEISHDKT
jgi:hypothetical protein